MKDDKLEQIEKFVLKAAMDAIESNNSQAVALAAGVLKIVDDDREIGAVALALFHAYLLTNVKTAAEFRQFLSENVFFDDEFREEMLEQSDEELEKFLEDLK